MKRNQAIALAVLFLAAGLILALALRNPQPPLLPTDQVHGPSVGAAACLGCHGAEGDVPRGKKHPLGDDCARCHGRR